MRREAQLGGRAAGRGCAPPRACPGVGRGPVAYDGKRLTWPTAHALRVPNHRSFLPFPLFRFFLTQFQDRGPVE